MCFSSAHTMLVTSPAFFTVDKHLSQAEPDLLHLCIIVRIELSCDPNMVIWTEHLWVWVYFVYLLSELTPWLATLRSQRMPQRVSITFILVLELSWWPRSLCKSPSCIHISICIVVTQFHTKQYGGLPRMHRYIYGSELFVFWLCAASGWLMFCLDM